MRARAGLEAEKPRSVRHIPVMASDSRHKVALNIARYDRFEDHSRADQVWAPHHEGERVEGAPYIGEFCNKKKERSERKNLPYEKNKHSVDIQREPSETNQVGRGQLEVTSTAGPCAAQHPFLFFPFGPVSSNFYVAKPLAAT